MDHSRSIGHVEKSAHAKYGVFSSNIGRVMFFVCFDDFGAGALSSMHPPKSEWSISSFRLVLGAGSYPIERGLKS